MVKVSSLILFFMLFINQSSYALADRQKLAIDSMLAKLKQKGIDTIIVYQEGCRGCEYPNPSDCNSSDDEIYITYIFICDKGKIYLQKTNECYLYKMIEIDDIGIFKYFYTNKKYFVEQIRFFYKLKEAVKKKKPIFLPPVPVHHSYKALSLISPEMKLDYEVIEEFEYDKNGNPLYLKYDWKKKQKEWTDLIGVLLKSIDMNKFIIETNL